MRNFLISIGIVVIFGLLLYIYEQHQEINIRTNQVEELRNVNDSLDSINNIFETKFYQYVSFRDLMSYSESRHNPNIYNKIGAYTKYQFLESTLLKLGVDITLNEFKRDTTAIFPEILQDVAFNEWMNLLDSVMDRRNTFDYIGYSVDTLTITKASLLAGSHLGGIGGVEAFICSNGMSNRSDGYTRISDYMYRFRDFDF